MAASKRGKEVWITYKGKRRQVKPCGIREPKDRVKGYRVEIRPPNSKTKIWVGTFETRIKAQRAFDAAVYLIGKEPYYHLYPGNYFPRRPPLTNFQKLKVMVQAEAKNYAEKSDPFPVNPSSLVLEASTRRSTIPESVESDRHEESVVEEADAEDLKPTQEEEFDDSLPSDTLPYLEDDQVQEPVEDDEAKVPAAYLRGLNAPNPSVVNALLDSPPPECFTVFSHIPGGGDSILEDVEEDPSSRLVPMEGERDSCDAMAAQFDDTFMSWSPFPAVPEDDCMEGWWGR